jgi:hypothetical protein
MHFLLEYFSFLSSVKCATLRAIYLEAYLLVATSATSTIGFTLTSLPAASKIGVIDL